MCSRGQVRCLFDGPGSKCRSDDGLIANVLYINSLVKHVVIVTSVYEVVSFGSGMNITTDLTMNEYIGHIPERMIRFNSLHPKFSKLTKDEVNTMLRLSF